MSAEPKIVAIGEAMVEMAPVEGGLYRRGFAGDTFNTIWHMAQLMGPRARCGFVTRVGTDALSDAFVAELAADGLDTAGIARDPDRTMGLYLIELDGAERSFHYWRGQSAARHLADDPEVLAAAVRGAAVLHLSGITLAILAPAARAQLVEVVAEARRTGTKIAFDPNLRPRLWGSADETRDAMQAVLAQTDIALPSFDDERALWGDASPADTLRRIEDAGVAEVVVKNGAGRVELSAAGMRSGHDTPAATKVVDTSGAGDAFDAGYLAARLSGRAPADAVALAQQVAGIVVGCHGARAPKDALGSVAASV